MKTAEQKIELIQKWSDWFYSHTDSFEYDNLGVEIAYLYAAIARNSCIQIFDPEDRNPLVKLLMENAVSPSDEIWEYIERVK